MYTDADYAAASNDRKPVSGIIAVIMLGNMGISWKRSTQKCVTDATCEAENVDLCDASKEVLFTRDVLVLV